MYREGLRDNRGHPSSPLNYMCLLNKSQCYPGLVLLVQYSGVLGHSGAPCQVLSGDGMLSHFLTTSLIDSDLDGSRTVFYSQEIALCRQCVQTPHSGIHHLQSLYHHCVGLVTLRLLSCLDSSSRTDVRATQQTHGCPKGVLCQDEWLGSLASSLLFHTLPFSCYCTASTLRCAPEWKYLQLSFENGSVLELP